MDRVFRREENLSLSDTDMFFAGRDYEITSVSFFPLSLLLITSTIIIFISMFSILIILVLLVLPSDSSTSLTIVFQIRFTGWIDNFVSHAYHLSLTVPTTYIDAYRRSSGCCPI